MANSSDHPRRVFEPWRLSGAGDPGDQRRRALFALAAPVFRRHGYRGATIKALAHACRLSPAGLYHHFGSKAEMATYLLRQRRMSWDTTWVEADVDPLVQLRYLVDLAVRELPNYLLAFRLADEIGGGPESTATRAAAYREGENVFARFLAAACPAMSREEASGTARDVLAALVGSAYIGIDPEPDAALRSRTVATLRHAMVPRHIVPDRFDDVMEALETE